MDGQTCMLTTFDNPFNPFTQFRKWFLFDVSKGYNSSAYLARIARTSDELNDEENNEEIERAIDEIIRYDFQNIYRKVTKGSYPALQTPSYDRGRGTPKNTPHP